MLKYLGVLVGCLALLAGCTQINDESFDGMDGNAGFAAMEIAQGGKAIMEAAEEGKIVNGTTKAAANPDSFTISWSYDTNSGSWKGNSTAYFPNGTVTRVDEVKFMKADGTPVDTPTIVLVDSVWHDRTSTLTGNTGQSIVIDVTSDAKLYKPAGGDTTATINGVGNCKFEALALATTTVTDVVYPKSKTEPKKWEFPSSGKVFIDRLLRTIDITFTGGNTATATVTNKVNNKTHTFNVNLVTGEETEI